MKNVLDIKIGVHIFLSFVRSFSLVCAKCDGLDGLQTTRGIGCYQFSQAHEMHCHGDDVKEKTATLLLCRPIHSHTN